MPDITRDGDTLTFTADGVRPVRFTYCLIASPALCICETCGAMVDASHVELHAIFHGWHRD